MNTISSISFFFLKIKVYTFQEHRQQLQITIALQVRLNLGQPKMSLRLKKLVLRVATSVTASVVWRTRATASISRESVILMLCATRRRESVSAIEVSGGFLNSDRSNFSNINPHSVVISLHFSFQGTSETAYPVSPSALVDQTLTFVRQTQFVCPAVLACANTVSEGMAFSVRKVSFFHIFLVT